jgi:uncharacterized iron-regulated membrane protein
VLLTIIACVLVADFISGLIHWWEDTYGLPTWPVIGRLVIEPNIDHHLNPGLMGTMAGFADRNYQPVLAALAVTGLAWLAGWFSWPLAAIAVMASLGNESHYWSHRGGNGPIVRFLHDACLVITPQQHAKHHKPPYDKYFCTITNLVNPVLERICFWKLLESLLLRAGLAPKRMTEPRKFV